MSSTLLPLAATTLWALSSLPVVFAERVCHTTLAGKVQCRNKLSAGVVIAIGATIVAVILLFLGLYLFIRHNRAKRAAAEAATYAVDANQIQGPPTTYAANYGIGSAPPGVYAGPGTAPTTYAAPNGIPQVYSGNPYNSQPQTAPSTLAYAPNSQYPTQVYPFKGYSSQTPTQNSPYVGGSANGIPAVHQEKEV